MPGIRARRRSLRTRLVILTLTVSAAALAVAGTATRVAMERYLVDRLDDQLVAAGPLVERDLRWEPQLKLPLPETSYIEFRMAGQPPVSRVYPTDTDAGSRPRIPDVDDVPLGQKWHGTVDAVNTGPAASITRYRLYVYPYIDEGTNGLRAELLLAAPMNDIDSTLSRLVMIEIIALLVALAVLAAFGRWLVGVGLRPLTSVADTARNLAAGDLNARVIHEEERTELGALGAAFNHMASGIQASFAARDESEVKLRQFVADASHELRTPLAAIRGYADLGARNSIDPQESLRRVAVEAERMGVLVDDLLLLARLDQNRELDRDVVDLTAVAADAIATVAVADTTHRFDLVATEPVTVLGDEGRLRHVAMNLLRNVQMHTPPGTPAGVRVFQQAGVAVLEVVDHGPGIEPASARRAFERFYRADQSRARVTGGSGLGLAIVAAIAQAHGGHASLDPTPGGGTTVRVTLPIDPLPASGQSVS